MCAGRRACARQVQMGCELLVKSRVRLCSRAPIRPRRAWVCRCARRRRARAEAQSPRGGAEPVWEAEPSRRRRAPCEARCRWVASFRSEPQRQGRAQRVDGAPFAAQCPQCTASAGCLRPAPTVELDALDALCAAYARARPRKTAAE
jgi:hypothetical protein